jgi:DNA-binding beta-propeller fold protein YncE
VSVIDGMTHTVTTTLDVGSWPAGVAVDPDIYTVYVDNNSKDADR